MRGFTSWISTSLHLSSMVCVLLCLFSAASARAETVVPLENYFGLKLTQFHKSIVAFNETPAAKENSFAFQDVQIWFAPEVTIGVSEMLELTIAPEIDFVLTPQAQ